MGIGIFRRKTWQYIQIVLAVLALLELMFFRTFVGGSTSLRGFDFGYLHTGHCHYRCLPQSKEHKCQRMDPTLFFMMAISIVEIIGVQIGVSNATIFMVVPLLICNAYQILTLHKVTKTKKS